jgi:pimeloyl-ACP methyl ester carboxylesterase
MVNCSSRARVRASTYSSRAQGRAWTPTSRFCMLFVSAVSLAAACSEDKTNPAEEELTDSGDPAVEMGDAGSGGVDVLPPLPEEITLPIVFAHGGAGSAQQYASQAMRFAANGYPQERIVAYDHDGAGFDVAQFLPGLDAVIDEARTRFGTEKVYLVGHSRGTLLSTNYLSMPDKAAKIAKYISLDGAPCPAGDIPCISPSQEILTGQKHVEVATSKESFVMQYQFLVGEEPAVVDIVKQKEPVVLSGRAVNFPQNTGREGSRLEFWEVDQRTGARVADEPLASFDIGADGDWGPVTVSPDKYYEQVLYTPGTTRYQHFYPQRYLRSSQLERLLSGPPDSPSRMNTNVGDNHVALTVLRMREWLPSDVLKVETKSESGDQSAPNVITDDNVSKMTNVMGRSVGEPIALYIHDDAATPGETTLAKLPWFPEQFFQSGMDVFIPGADPANGTITLTNLPRGDGSKPQTLNVPNWSSTDHVVTVVFSDFPQD